MCPFKLQVVTYFEYYTAVISLNHGAETNYGGKENF